MNIQNIHYWQNVCLLWIAMSHFLNIELNWDKGYIVVALTVVAFDIFRRLVIHVMPVVYGIAEQCYWFVTRLIMNAPAVLIAGLGSGFIRGVVTFMAPSLQSYMPMVDMITWAIIIYALYQIGREDRELDEQDGAANGAEADNE